MNRYYRYFKAENELLNGKYDHLDTRMQELTSIVDSHGYSDSSVAYLAEHLRRFKSSLVSESYETLADTPLIRPSESGFSNLFDYLEELLIEGELDAELMSVFINALMLEPISPLTGDESEWMKVSPDGLYQNKRMSSVFKEGENAYWIDGSVILECSENYAHINSSIGIRAPKRSIRFPFDPSVEKFTYYFMDYTNPELVMLEGTYDEIKDEVQAIRVSLRRQWLQGLDPVTGKYRSVILQPVLFSELVAAIDHFEQHIRPVLDDKGISVIIDDSYVYKHLFEGTSLAVISPTITAILYRCAYLYMQFDKNTRQNVFDICLEITPWLYPTKHHQSFAPKVLQTDLARVSINDFEPQQGVFITEDKQPLTNKQTRSYLYNRCKERNLEFKPGKHGDLIGKFKIPTNSYVSACITPSLRDDSRPIQCYTTMVFKESVLKGRVEEASKYSK